MVRSIFRAIAVKRIQTKTHKQYDFIRALRHWHFSTGELFEFSGCSTFQRYLVWHLWNFEQGRLWRPNRRNLNPE